MVLGVGVLAGSGVSIPPSFVDDQGAGHDIVSSRPCPRQGWLAGRLDIGRGVDEGG